VLPETAAPALVSADLAAQVHRRLRLDQVSAVRNAHHPEKGLLRGGIARCGYCGGALYVHHINAYLRKAGGSRGGDMPERWVYKCKNATRTRGQCSPHAIDIYRFDPVVWAKVCEVLQTPGLLEHEVEYMRASEQPGSDVLASIDKIIADLSAQIARKRRLFELTDDEKAQNEFADEINGLAALRRQHEAERVNAEVHYADWQQQQTGLEYALAWRERVAARLESANTYAEKRMILEAANVEVRLWRADHEPRVRLWMRLPLAGTIIEDLPMLVNCDETGTRDQGTQRGHCAHSASARPGYAPAR
jgi:site-specific DNA recombinase